ncbi:MAG: hypothetical protein BAJATHORv1_30083 [Candidatus Thorarchaeota archaeon]|nr:MAG: hypothetical protein BAJATHORv1_30083 [Candidatus Thorarchaeota archaeon]
MIFRCSIRSHITWNNYKFNDLTLLDKFPMDKQGKSGSPCTHYGICVLYTLLLIMIERIHDIMKKILAKIITGIPLNK